jgi:cytoskeletal protein CcmA (bactofilin family)
MATWKKVITSGSQAQLNTLAVDTTLTVNADRFEFTGSVGISGSLAISGSASIVGGILTGTSSFAISASWSPGSQQSETASFVTASNVWGPFGSNSIRSASYAVTAAFALNVPATSSYSLVASASSVTDTTTGTGPFYLTFVDGTTGNRPLRVDSTTLTFNATTNILTATASNAVTSSNANTASLALSAAQVANSLTAGAGLTGTTFNGSAASTFDVGAGALINAAADFIQVNTSSLTTNQIPKLGSNTLAGSNISDTGTQVQIAVGASSGLSVAAGGVTVTAGGVTVTGNSTFNNNLTVAGDLTVAGTASFQNTQNLLIGDRFAALASGSTSVTDGGIIIVSSAGVGGMSGSAWLLESATGATPNYGRFAAAPNVHVSASTVTTDLPGFEWAVTAKISALSNPSAAPTWGGSVNGSGNMWINDSTGDIFIYA